MDGSKELSVTVEDLLERARRRIQRVGPHELEALLNEGGLLIDIRPEGQRLVEGIIPGAHIVERNVLEWRLDPDSDHRMPEVRDRTQPVILMCSRGYASSLAAASLVDLGFEHAGDLVGGYHAWRAWFDIGDTRGPEHQTQSPDRKTGEDRWGR